MAAIKHYSTATAKMYFILPRELVAPGVALEEIKYMDHQIWLAVIAVPF